MDEILEKMRKYVENTKNFDIPEGFQLRTSEVIALVEIARHGDANHLYDAILLTFAYGYAKRMRVACAENKKRCLI